MTAAIAWPEALEAVATLVGSIGVIAALIYSARQTRAIGNQARLQREEAERDGDLQQARLELRLMEMTIGIDRLFLDRPHLRPYFRTNRGLGRFSSPRRRGEVTSMAEVVIDFVDLIAGLRRHGQITGRNYENWRVFTRGYYEQSPAVRALWEDWRDEFLPETADLLCGPESQRLDAPVPGSGAEREEDATANASPPTSLDGGARRPAVNPLRGSGASRP